MTDLFGHPELNRPKSKRADARRRLEAARVAKMHAIHGNGPAGQTCKGCIDLIRVKPGANSFLKCGLYGLSASEASDWRAKWPACGKYRATL
jgi:hypothetical protein